MFLLFVVGVDQSFANFFSKFDMLSFYPFREISCEIRYAVHFPPAEISNLAHLGVTGSLYGSEAEAKMRFRPPETPFSSETDGFHQIDDTHDESIYGNFIFGSIVFDFWDFFSRRGCSLTAPPFFLERNHANFMKISTKLDSGAIETVSRN